MTAPTISAYPRPVEDLLPAARKLAERIGEVPSRNRLMKEFKVGAPKATALLEALQLADTAPAAVVVDPVDAVTPVSLDLVAATAVPESVPPVEPVPAAPPADPAPIIPPQAGGDGHPDANITTDTPPIRPAKRRRVAAWPLVLIALPAMVAIWAGWVGLGGLTGFGMVNLLPGIVADNGWATINSAITLPIGVEVYAAYALRAWLSGSVPAPARRFARWSAITSLGVGALGQVAYHVLEAAGVTAAPWWITTLVACLPVAVVGMGAALHHLLHSTDDSK